MATYAVLCQSDITSHSHSALRKIVTAWLVLSRFIGLQQGDPDVTFDKLPAGAPRAPLQPGMTLLDLGAVSYQQLMDLSAASAANPFGELLPFNPGVMPSRLGYMTGGASKPICAVCEFGLTCCMFMCRCGTLKWSARVQNFWPCISCQICVYAVVHVVCCNALHHVYTLTLAHAMQHECNS